MQSKHTSSVSSGTIATRLIADTPSLIASTAESFRGLGAYGDLDPSEVAESVQRNLRSVVEVLTTGHLPSDQVLTSSAEVVVRRRISQGIPVEDMMRSYRISMALINDHYVAVALGSGATPHSVLASSRLLWSLSDAFMTCVALQYQTLSIESAVLEDQAKADLIHTLLLGNSDSPEVIRAAAAKGLHNSDSFYAIRARVTDAKHLLHVCQALERGSAPSTVAVVVPYRGEAIGLTKQIPPEVVGSLVGVGPSTTLAAAPHSFSVAGRVLEAAADLGRTGVVTLADLSWRLAAVNELDVSRLLVDRYITPLRDKGDFGDQLLESVRTFLANDRNVNTAAEKMYMHKNTLRYRLSKFEEITAASLNSTDTLIEIAWALEVDMHGITR